MNGFLVGIAVAAGKHIIPIMSQDMTLPFDVQHLDALLYSDLDELKRKLIVSVRGTLRKPKKRSVIKEPKLELLLIDHE